MRLRRVAAAVLWAAAGIAAIAVWTAQGGIIWLAAGAAIACLPFVSLALQLLVRKKIDVSVAADTMAQKGTAMQITVTVKNAAFLSTRAAVRVHMHNTLTQEETISELLCHVPPHGEMPLRLLMQSSHCGRIHTSVQCVRLLDVCGFLAIRRKPQDASTRTTILPELFPTEIGLNLSAAVSDDSESYAPNVAGSDFTELYQLREYVPGDSLRRIHWKLTAKTEQVVVREGSLPMQRSLLVFWDKTAGEIMEPTAADALAESAASVCQGLSEAGYVYTLGWSGEDSPVLEETYNTDSLLSLLPRMIAQAGSGRSGTETLTADQQTATYGRILLFAHTLPPKLEMLCKQSRVTLFLCAEEDAEAPCQVIRFTPENYTQCLQNLEFLE